MPIVRRLLAHMVIATMTLGGISCFCPAATAHAAVPAHAGHAHASDAEGPTGTTGAAGCAHHASDTDCTLVSAASAKSQAATPGKAQPQLEEIESLPFVPGSGPAASRQPNLSDPQPNPPWLSHDSPVRRFDRLLD